MQLQLFDISPATPAVNQKPPVGARCKNCIWSYKHTYRRDWLYCGKQLETQKGRNHHKKIKFNDDASKCPIFETITATLIIQT